MTHIDNYRATRFATFTLVALAIGALLARPAHAELGGTMPTPQAGDGSIQHVLPGGAVRMRSFVDAGGTTINEYATRDGLVFACAWQGPTMPDLSQLLAGTRTRSGRKRPRS